VVRQFKWWFWKLWTHENILSYIKNLWTIINQQVQEDWIWAEKCQRWSQRNPQKDLTCLCKNLQLQLASPQKLLRDWIWVLTHSWVSSLCGGQLALCAYLPERRPVGHRRCAQMLGDWLAGWKEEDMSLEDRLSVPDGPLRKNRRRSRISAPEKPQAINDM
jgi:hypothetical protein